MIVAAFLFGLLIGSFLNVCIHRWPIDESILRPARSYCPSCKRQIAWYDNVPLLSYVLLRGRCRACGASISWRYPLVELLNGLLYAGLAATQGLTPEAAKAALFCSMILALIFTDFEHYILPDELTWGGLAIGLALSLVVAVPPSLSSLFWLITESTPSPRLGSLAESALGAAVFGGLLWAMREAYYRIRGVDGLGLGDVKMAAMMGSFWGVGPTLLILLLGSLGGSLIGTAIIVLGGKKWSHELPFGSYLGAAALIVTLWGDRLFNLYWQSVGAGA
ncbi:MAG: prepilin peptidase [Acidobacteria bacterium]|nr:prepilin peptidase [Acidobacteriota bacterium]